MGKKLNSSEAVYGFAAWLTGREEEITIGAHHDAAPVAERVKEFCEANSLPDVSKDWPDNLIHPKH